MSSFFKELKTYWHYLIGIVAPAVLWIVRRNAQLSEQNKALRNDLKTHHHQATQIIELQKKQQKLAARPLAQPDAVLEWLREWADERDDASDH